MEDCECSLSNYIRSNTEIKVSIKIKWALQISEAVAYLHDHQWLHCDIKPSNILLKRKSTGKLVTKLTDLGLSKSLADSSDHQLTSKFDYAALAWIAPELYTSPLRSSTASDVWALGCLIYFIFSWGKHPFDSREGKSLADRVTNITNKRVNLDALRYQQSAESDRVNRRLQSLILSMIDQNPSSRFQIGKVVDRLKNIHKELSDSTQIVPVSSVADQTNGNLVKNAIDGVFNYLIGIPFNHFFSNSTSDRGSSSSSSNPSKKKNKPEKESRKSSSSYRNPSQRRKQITC